MKLKKQFEISERIVKRSVKSIKKRNARAPSSLKRGVGLRGSDIMRPCQGNSKNILYNYSYLLNSGIREQIHATAFLG